MPQKKVTATSKIRVCEAALAGIVRPELQEIGKWLLSNQLHQISYHRQRVHSLKTRVGGDSAFGQMLESIASSQTNGLQSLDGRTDGPPLSKENIELVKYVLNVGVEIESKSIQILHAARIWNEWSERNLRYVNMVNRTMSNDPLNNGTMDPLDSGIVDRRHIGICSDTCAAVDGRECGGWRIISSDRKRQRYTKKTVQKWMQYMIQSRTCKWQDAPNELSVNGFEAALNHGGAFCSINSLKKTTNFNMLGGRRDHFTTVDSLVLNLDPSEKLEDRLKQAGRANERQPPRSATLEAANNTYPCHLEAALHNENNGQCLSYNTEPNLQSETRPCRSIGDSLGLGIGPRLMESFETKMMGVSAPCDMFSTLVNDNTIPCDALSCDTVPSNALAPNSFGTLPASANVLTTTSCARRMHPDPLDETGTSCMNDSSEGKSLSFRRYDTDIVLPPTIVSNPLPRVVVFECVDVNLKAVMFIMRFPHTPMAIHTQFSLGVSNKYLMRFPEAIDPGMVGEHGTVAEHGTVTDHGADYNHVSYRTQSTEDESNSTILSATISGDRSATIEFDDGSDAVGTVGQSGDSFVTTSSMLSSSVGSQSLCSSFSTVLNRPDSPNPSTSLGPSPLLSATDVFASHIAATNISTTGKDNPVSSGKESLQCSSYNYSLLDAPDPPLCRHSLTGNIPYSTVDLASTVMVSKELVSKEPVLPDLTSESYDDHTNQWRRKNLLTGGGNGSDTLDALAFQALPECESCAVTIKDAGDCSVSTTPPDSGGSAPFLTGMFLAGHLTGPYVDASYNAEVGRLDEHSAKSGTSLSNSSTPSLLTSPHGTDTAQSSSYDYNLASWGNTTWNNAGATTQTRMDDYWESGRQEMYGTCGNYRGYGSTEYFGYGNPHVWNHQSLGVELESGCGGRAYDAQEQGLLSVADLMDSAALMDDALRLSKQGYRATSTFNTEWHGSDRVGTAAKGKDVEASSPEKSVRPRGRQKANSKSAPKRKVTSRAKKKEDPWPLALSSDDELPLHKRKRRKPAMLQPEVKKRSRRVASW